ncbi:MAG: carboxypeptidase-like regulatory domain-containing protein, partial [Bacteroidales bacterium]|nr:carboxypeptidase-like regulatory domain-containing protein [Bacteroidales bacterium]
MIVGTVFLNIYNINPKSAQESIPNDEPFLYEEPAAQGTAPVQEEKSVDQIISEVENDMEQEVLAKEMDPAPQKELAREDAPDREEIVVHEEKALRAVEMVSDDAEVSAEVMAEVPAEAPAQLPAEIPAEVSAQLADEVVIMEAQPKRSQKKSRSKEAAPLAYSTEKVGGVVLSSEDMEPLPGASIMVKGSDSGMVADMEGRFTIVADQQTQTTVIASYVGMETEEYQLAGGTENRVVMQPDMATLNEVVVIEYDADKKAYATGAVQTVKLDKEESKYSGAEPEGGLEAFKMYMEEQIRFPAGNTISKREVVVLKFNVALDGSISQILTLRSPGDPYTEEAIRLLNEGPSWNPAKDENGATD